MKKITILKQIIFTSILLSAISPTWAMEATKPQEAAYRKLVAAFVALLVTGAWFLRQQALPLRNEEKELNDKLQKAVKDKNIDEVKKLLSEGANVDAKDREGNTPLYIAAQEGYKKIVQLLLGSGANINATNKQGNTPLHLAALFDNYEIVKLLLNKGADPNINDKVGRTSLDFAQKPEIKGLIQGEIDYRKALARRALEEPVPGIELPSEIREMIMKASEGKSIKYKGVPRSELPESEINRLERKAETRRRSK